MGRELQKKKNRSANPKVTRRKNNRHQIIKSFGNEIIRQHWDNKQTLTQNYARIGLATRLNTPNWCAANYTAINPATLKAPAAAAALPVDEADAPLRPGEARIVRDDEGNVLRIEHGPSADEALDQQTAVSEPFVDTRTEVVKLLESLQPGEKRERQQSDREKEWVGRLVAKYGKDFKKMEKDRKLNPMQQTANDLKRRVAKWEAVSATETN